MKALVIAVLAFVMSGCVTGSYSSPSVASNSTGVDGDPPSLVCRMEKPTGSNRPVKVCRAAPGVFDKEDTRRDMGVLQRQSEILGDPNRK